MQEVSLILGNQSMLQMEKISGELQAVQQCLHRMEGTSRYYIWMKENYHGDWSSFGT